MKRYVHAFLMCQSMFCAIPCPTSVWDEDARPLMLLFLPVIGLEMGLLWAVLAWLCRILSLPPLITGLLLCIFPYLVSGFIHLDGFLDVTDAIGSCRDLEKRRAILKDSHVGAFAVIGCGILLLAGFAFCASAEGTPWILAAIPVVSRCCSALAVTLLRPMHTSQYAGGVPRRVAVFPAALLVLTTAAAFVLGGMQGFVLLGGLAAYGLALRTAYRALDGMNGDISGYALTISELAAVAVWALL